MLSIIIPAKNEGNYIDECLTALIKSILFSKIKAEVIVVNNGSIDSTKTIARKHGCTVIEKLQGNISSIRNFGAKNAKGDIFAFLDADCIVSKNWISYCIENFKKDHIAIVGTRAIPDLNHSTWVERAWYRLISGAPRPDYVQWLGTSNIFVRKDAFFEVHGFNEDLETAEDVDFCYRLTDSGYRIILEKRTDTIHLRESKTLIDLFKREFWRGKSSLRSFKILGYPKSEIISVFMPGITFLVGILFVLSIFISLKFVVFFLLILLIMPTLLIVKKKARIKTILEFMQCYFVSFTYISARSASFGNEIFSGIKNKLLC